MKKIIILLLITFVFKSISYSQNWKEMFYAPSEIKGGKSFFDMQKDFNEYWSKYDVKGGYYFINGKKYKAAGWKQFKRWEWYWETRINRKTGDFPDINILKIQSGYLKNYKSKSDLSNWQNMGPDNSYGGYAGIGRINCVAFHPSNPDIFWVGAPSGGLWKTIDGGNSWEVLTDTLPVIGVSDIIIPNDYETSNTIYIATGDRDAGDNYSIGVLKTTDEGNTWTSTGLSFNVSNGYRITRMLVHPTQQNIFYAATNGGIFKSTNSGDSWSEVQNGLFYDMEFKYGCEDTVLFAATVAYSDDSKIYKTYDGGTNWSVVYTFPSTVYRVELDAAQSDSTIVYAMACTGDGGLEGIYKSENSGESFSKIYDGTISGNNLLNWFDGDSDVSGQGWYDLTLSVSPVDENHIFLGGINSWESLDGGITWNIVNHWYGANGVPAVHADKHYMEFRDENTFFEANDGGIYKTTNGGDSWVDLTDGMIISQIYKLGVSQTVSDEVILGLQDNGSKLITSGTWYDVKGGDGMECLIDYTDVNVQYATYTNGQIDRTTDHWSNAVDISANIPGGEDGAWVTPYLIDPENNQTIYVGYADVWKTTNRGDSWTKISSLSLSNRIRSMAIAPSDNQTLYITDFDSFYRTTNGGSNWENLTSNLPSTSNSITYISVDAFNPVHVWITFGGYDNVKAYESFDGGESWNNISSGLPSVPANTIIQNKLSGTQHLYVGTDIGVFFKDGSSDWTLFSNNLPSVIVTELEIFYDNSISENSVLYASTYGRGLWKSNLSAFEVSEIYLNEITGPFYVSNDSSAQIQINYELNETFTSNTFTAYLSDETGSFTNQVEIGNLVSDVEGTINGEIPAGTIPGTNYKVKVVSSSPVFESPVSNAFEVVLDTQSPSVVISSASSGTTSGSPINITITFNEIVSGFEQTDIVVGNGAITAFNTSNNTLFTAQITPTTSGAVTVDIAAEVAIDIAGNSNTAATQWSINYIPTGIEDLKLKGINIFPIPANNELNIEFEQTAFNVNIQITDLSGKIKFNEGFNEFSNKKINLYNYAKGVYIIKIAVGNQINTARIIIN